MPPSARVAIRLDSGRAIGAGHATRDLVIARAFMEAGCEVRFVSRDTPDSYFRTAATSAAVMWIPPLSDAVLSSRELNLHDARLTLDACRRHQFSPDLVMLDHYDLDWAWETEVRAMAKAVLVVEDYEERVHAADFVWSASSAPRRREHYRRVEATRFFLGPAYLPIGDEYQRGAVSPMPPPPHRLLIFFGSSDLTGETSKTLMALEAHSGQNRIGATEVVVGSSNPRIADLRGLVAAIPGASLSVQLPSLAASLTMADVVLTSGGNSMIESVAMGKPTIVVGTARNQLELCREFAQVPYVVFAGEHGDVTGEAIAMALDDLPERFNREIRPALVSHPVDTDGARRVAAEVLRHLGEWKAP